MSIDRESCIRHLQGMVQFPTVSNPDPDSMNFEPFHALHQYLEQSYPLVHKTMTREIIGYAGLLYHWKGTGRSKQLPLLLMAHQDVVPEGDHTLWKYPPFSGEVAEGKLWGRGTTDSKNNIMAHMEALEDLIASGFCPDYDLYLAYGYNEEIMGGKGPAAKLIADTLQQRGVRLGCVIDECGGCGSGASQKIDGDICEIIVAEKGYADYLLSYTHKGGHSSVPPKEGAFYQMAKAITAIEEHQMPYRITDAVKAKLETLAPHRKDALGKLLCDVSGNWPQLLEEFENNPALAAMFHTTTAITMAQGSAQANILPEKVTVTINTRPLEGDSLEDIRQHFLSLVPEGVEVTLVKGNEATPVSPTDSWGYRLLQSISEEMYPGIIATPGYLLGGTDSRYYCNICENIYRFGSFYHNSDYGPAHSANECMPVDQITSGPLFFQKFLTRYGG